MKKILLAVGLSFLAFILGFAGIYFAMPSLNPDLVSKTRHQLDSLSLLNTDVQNLDSTEVDTLRLLLSPLDSLQNQNRAWQDTLQLQEVTISNLEDSLRQAHKRMNTMEEGQSNLLSRINELIKRLDSLEAKRAEAKGLSTTLPKLETKELSAILGQLDMNVLQMLYAEASERNRPIILASLPADRAAGLVRRLFNVSDSPPLPPTEQTPTDTTDTKDTKAETTAGSESLLPV